MDAEWRSGDGANEVLIDPGRIKREIDPEWRVEDRHDDLKFDAGTHTQPGIRPGKELRRQVLDQSWSNNLALQFGRLEDPCVSCIHEWHQRNDVADQRNPVLE